MKGGNGDNLGSEELVSDRERTKDQESPGKPFQVGCWAAASPECICKFSMRFSVPAGLWRRAGTSAGSVDGSESPVPAEDGKCQPEEEFSKGRKLKSEEESCCLWLRRSKGCSLNLNG